MWLFGRHKHLSYDRLSEYLDGRLSADELARVDRAVAQCTDCREELESLRETRSLLQSLPQLELQRTFTFAAAPVTGHTGSPERARPAVFRVPGWAYAGAAAVAGIAAVLIVVTAGSDLWFSGAAYESSGTIAMSAPASQQASAPAQVSAAQALPEPTAAPAAASGEFPMAQAESAPPEPASVPASPGDRMVTSESMAAVPAEVRRSAEVGTVTEQVPEQATVADVPTPTAAPMAMMEADMAVEGEAPAEPEAIELTPTAVHVAKAATEASVAEPAGASESEVLEVTPTPAGAAAVPASVEATATPVPLLEPEPTAPGVPKEQATVLPQPTLTPAAAGIDGEPELPPDAPSVFMRSTEAKQTPSPAPTSVPTSVPSQPPIGITAIGRAGPVATPAATVGPTIGTAEQETVLAPVPQPAAVGSAPQPAEGEAETTGARPGEGDISPTTEAAPPSTLAPSVASEAELNKGEPAAAVARATEEAVPGTLDSTPERLASAPTPAPEPPRDEVFTLAPDTPAGSAGTQPQQFPEIGAAESGEPQDDGSGLPWVLVGSAVIVLLLLLAFGRKALLRLSSSE